MEKEDYLIILYGCVLGYAWACESIFLAFTATVIVGTYATYISIKEKTKQS